MAKKDKKKQKDERMARLLGAAAGMTSAEATLVPAVFNSLPAALSDIGTREYPAGKALADVDPELFERAKKIRRHLKAPEIPITTGEEASALFDRHHTPTSIVINRKNLPILAHEIGHTVPSVISRVAGIMQRNPAAFFAGPAAGVLMGLSDNETAQSLAPAVSASTSIPRLADEINASAKAMKGIRAAEGNAAAVKALGRLGPAFMTYLIASAPALFAPYIARKTREFVQEEREKTAGRLKTPATFAWATKGPKPQSSKPGDPPDPGDMKPNLPSKGKFYRDMLKSIHDPKRGIRQ